MKRDRIILHKGDTTHHSQRERRRVPQSMIHNQSTHSIEAGEQISIMPLEDKDHHGGF
jgi:hypothetical protein